MNNSVEPNCSAFYEQLGRIGPQLLSGVPRELKEWLAITSEDTDEFFPGYSSPVDTLSNLWGDYSPEEAVKEALITWLDNVKDAIMSDIMVAEVYEDDYEKTESIADRIALRERPELINRLIKAAMKPKGSIPVERLSFELLPPGTWNIDDVIAHFQKEKARLPNGLSKRSIQEMRLMMIRSLQPEKCYVGSEQWLGYVVFEFADTDKVILECPIEGNATYVLSGDWKSMVQHTKRLLRENYQGRYTKVVHKGDWLNRVRQALFHG